jgi:hypothetical protein
MVVSARRLGCYRMRLRSRKQGKAAQRGRRDDDCEAPQTRDDLCLYVYAAICEAGLCTAKQLCEVRAVCTAQA